MVASKAEGQMLWIALQERETNHLRPSYSENKLRQVVEDAPRGLDQLYEVNLSRINHLGSNDKKRAWRILNWIMYSLRPLTVQEIVEAVLIEDNDDFEEFPDDELPDDPNEVDVYGELRNLCGNFVAFELNGKDNEPRYWQVRFAHSSIRIFLSQHLEQGDIGGGTSASTQSTLLARLCIRYLMYDNVWPKDAATSQQLTMENHPLLTYAATYFVLHINPDNRQNVESLVQLFLLSHYSNYFRWRQLAWNTQNPASVGLSTFKNAWQWKNRLRLAAALGLAKVVETICDAENVQNSQSVLEDSQTLQAASWSNSPSTAQVLLDRGFQINQSSEDGFTPLHMAAARGNTEVVEFLVNNGADLNKVSNFGTPLHRAAWWNRESAVESLLNHKADLMVLDPDGGLPLHDATKKGYQNITRAFLRAEPVASSTINRTNDDRWSPLLLAVDLGDRELVEMLLQHSANPTQLGHHGVNPLLLSAEKGKEDVFDLILNACVDMSTVINNFNTETGASLLHLAVQGKNLDIVKKLIQKGADTMKLDYYYRTPLDVAIQSGYIEMVDFLFSTQRNHNADLPIVRPLHYACDQGHKDLVDILIKKGADLKACTLDGWTPLACAADNGHTEVVELILKHEDGKSTVNSKLSDGLSPLIIACEGGYVRIIELLLENGADMLATSEPGCGPMSHATISGNVQAVEILLDKCGSNFPELFVLHNAAWSGDQDVFNLVKKYYPSNDATFMNGATIPHCAARGGNVEIINDILSAGDPDQLLRATSKANETVLSWATRTETIEAAKVILSRCAQLSRSAPFDDVALYNAIENNNLELVKLLHEADPATFMEGRLPEVSEDSPRPPLHQACYHGRVGIMEFLIEKGFKIDDRDDRGRTCLHEFAETGNEAVARFFRHIDWKAGLAVTDEDGFTPILQAAYAGQSRVFRRFLRQGASILDRVESSMPATLPDTGGTLLHAAASCSDTGIADLILKSCGKDCLEWRNQSGETPVHVAACNYQHLFLEYLSEQGAKMDALTFQRETPLFFAVCNGSELATPFLLSKGVASLEKQLGSPIMAYAALFETPFILNNLIDHGFELDYGQQDGVTLLHLAAGFHLLEIVTFLLVKGLDWDSGDNHGWTVRDCLETSRFQDSPDFETDRSDGPRSWQKCTAWAFSALESAWFVQDADKTIAKIKESSILSETLVEYPMWTITTDHYLLPTLTGSYFEVTLLECPPSSAIGIGLAILIGEYNRCEYSSALYYGESGWVQNSDDGISLRYAYPYGQGDTIGCGIDYKAGNIFFTKNRECLGCASDECYERLTPAVFSVEKSLKFKGNFGQKPFLFDVAKHGWDNTEKCKRCYDEKGELYVRIGDDPDWDEEGDEGSGEGSEDEWEDESEQSDEA